MAAKKTPWGWIIFGIVAFTMLVGVGLVVVAGFFVYQQFAFRSDPATERAATARFEEVAKRFEGQEPLLVIKDGEPVLLERHEARSGPPRRIEALHVMVWEPNNERVVSLNIPFWLIRMTNGHPIKLSTSDEHVDVTPQLKITAHDLERHGPGLILMHSESSGERVIVWAQ
jgi:hypothetical protein